MTFTVSVVVPVILPAFALFEFSILIAVQELATQVKELKLPLVPHLAVPPPEYPVLHVTVVV